MVSEIIVVESIAQIILSNIHDLDVEMHKLHRGLSFVDLRLLGLDFAIQFEDALFGIQKMFLSNVPLGLFGFEFRRILWNLIFSLLH